MNDSATLRIIASEENWIEGEAVRQLEKTATLPGMKTVIGLPDLHPGKGSPVGGAFFSQAHFYPYLIGNDIGCGMGLWITNLKNNKIKRDSWERKLSGLERSWEEDLDSWLLQENLPSNTWDRVLGTIGGGNHFAELQIVDAVEDKELFHHAGLRSNRLFLLVHSGSRGVGEEILRKHVDRYQDSGLQEGTDVAEEYLAEHAYAIWWAVSNRALIAYRFLSLLGTAGERVLDVCHNSLSHVQIHGRSGWLHRKGAAPSDEGLLVIPGSRGSFSYLVSPTGDQSENCFSVAHGAGRKWKRSESRSRLQQKYPYKSLLRTTLGSKVICEDKNLLYEEAPQAYKNIDIVVQDLLNAGLIRVVARLKPLITYKTRRG